LNISRILIRVVCTAAILLYQDTSFAETASELKEKYFSGIEAVKVIETAFKGEQHYFVLAVSHEPLAVRNMDVAKKRNNLITRAALLRHMENKSKVDKSSLAIEIRGLVKVGDWNRESTFFQLSYVPISSVRFVSKKDTSSDSVSLATIENEVKAEIAVLETYAQKHPKSVETQQSLYNLYMANGDVDGANKSMDKFMDLKF
jgi:hypothetical protein